MAENSIQITMAPLSAIAAAADAVAAADKASKIFGRSYEAFLPPPLKQTCVNYSQRYAPNPRGPFFTYYDPSTLWNRDAFSLGPGEEVIVRVQGSAYGMCDEEILPGSIENVGGPMQIKRERRTSTMMLFLRLKHPTVILTVGSKTNLQMLLASCSLYINQVYGSHEDSYSLIQRQRESLAPGAGLPRKNNNPFNLGAAHQFQIQQERPCLINQAQQGIKRPACQSPDSTTEYVAMSPPPFNLSMPLHRYNTFMKPALPPTPLLPMTASVSSTGTNVVELGQV